VPAHLRRSTTRDQAASRVAFSFTQAEFSSPICEPPHPVSALRLSEEQLSMHMDLGPYVNPRCEVVCVCCVCVCLCLCARVCVCMCCACVVHYRLFHCLFG
jgi:hypothetical protein